MLEVTPRTVTPGGALTVEPDEAEVLAAHAAVPTDHDAAAPGAQEAAAPDRFAALFGAAPHGATVFSDKNGGAGTHKSGAAGSIPSTEIGGAHAPALTPGSHGPQVRELQRQLNQWRAEQWPRQQPIAEDGRFTKETKQAVEEFQKANRVNTGSGARVDYTPNGMADVRVQNLLRLENDPTFKKLDVDDKALARNIVRNADTDGARAEPLLTLLKDPSFGLIGAAAQHRMLEQLDYQPRYPSEVTAGTLSKAELVKEYTKLAGNPNFRKLDPSIQATLVGRLNSIATPLVSMADAATRVRTGLDNLTRLVNSAGFRDLPPDDQRLVIRALGTDPADRRLMSSLLNLLGSEQFDDLKPAAKTAVVSQIANYPDDRAVANIERLLDKNWFTAQSLEDKQRSLKTVAYLSQHDGGDRAVIDNTLDKLLDIDSDLKLQWDDFSGSVFDEGDEERRSFGQADAATQTLTLNSQKVPRGNGAVPENYNGKHLVLHTVAHEVNHLLNRDVPRNASFQHFEIEYRAWVVGFKAEHGHYPTNKEAMERVRQLLTADKGAYADIKGAGRKYHDAMQMYSFLQKMTGREVTAGNIDDILKSAPETWRNWSRDPSEQGAKQADRLAPLVDGNLENQ